MTVQSTLHRRRRSTKIGRCARKCSGRTKGKWKKCVRRCMKR